MPVAPPKIENLLPAPGGDLGADWQVGRFTAISFDVARGGGAALDTVMVWGRYIRSQDAPFLIYDGSAFAALFSALSTVTGTDPMQFSILPNGGWHNTITELEIFAVNTDGEIEGMMPYFVESVSAELSTAGKVISLAKPTDLREGDLLLALVGAGNASLGTPNTVAVAPADWTQVATATANRTDETPLSWQGELWRKVVSDPSSEPSQYDFIADVAEEMAAVLIVVRDVDTDDPVDVVNTTSQILGGTSTSHAAPSVTTTDDHRLIVAGYLVSVATTYTPDAGMTERVEDGENADVSVMLSDAQQEAAGATGTFTATSADPGYHCMFTVAFKPRRLVPA